MLTTMLVIAAALSAPPGAATDIAVGQVIANEPGQTLNGWTHNGGGLYPLRRTQNYVTTETSECCYAHFQKGNEHLVLVTSSLARKPTGGELASRVVRRFKIRQQPGEQTVSCSLLWIDPALSLYNESTKMVRSVVITGDQFTVVSWKDDIHGCVLGD
jgi:hypothetical protein